MTNQEAINEINDYKAEEFKTTLSRECLQVAIKVLRIAILRERNGDYENYITRRNY